jgi:Zn-dependent peptidase ImmA (M78 family)/transcriptional regulator with XRE-family HTH domain
MAKSFEALVEPELLVWARKSAGLSVNEAAKKVEVKPARLEAWEMGITKPTMVKLRKLGLVYKRPIAVFFLPEPPKDFQPLRDFRQFPGASPHELSSALTLEIRNAQNRRAIALELMEGAGVEPPIFTNVAHLTDDPEQLSLKIRGLLGVTYERQLKWRRVYEPFNNWRAMLENMGFLVFQATEVNISEMRGFSISENPFPVIVVNRKDTPRARIFTMAHELVHVMLKAGGICDFEDEPQQSPENQAVEIFCNRIAGSILVPRANLLREGAVVSKKGVKTWSDDEIVGLSDTYGVSREVILRRLLVLGKTNDAFYKQKIRQYQKEYDTFEPKKTLGFILPHQDVVTSTGKPFVRMVLDAYHQEKITASDVSDYLEVKIKHLDKIQSLVATI